MSNEIELSREILESGMDQDVKEFLRQLILLPEDELSQAKVNSLLEIYADGSK